MTSKGADDKITDEDLIKHIEYFNRRRKQLSTRFYESAYYQISQPIIDNNISRKVDNAVFHTVAGKTAIFSMEQLNSSMGSCLVFLTSLRLNATVEYILREAEFTSHGLVTSTAFCFALLVLHGIFVSTQKKMVLEKTDGNTNIFEDSIEDVLYNREYKKFTN